MYRITSVDGQDEAEKLLNETMNAGGELVQAHVYTARHEPPGEQQQNSMLESSVTRFTFIFRLADQPRA